MNRKALAGFEIKSESKGLVEAVFSTFNVIDSDDDVTLPGAFTDGAQAPISAYGHKSWDGVLPVGIGTIRQTRTEAILSGQFFMHVPEAAATFETVKALGSLGQWSYGYEPQEFSFGEFEGRRVRFLAKQLVHEVSPVLVGAGVGTRTMSAKSGHGRRGEDYLVGIKGAIRPHETDVVNEMWDSVKALSQLPDGMSVTDLRAVAAWVDPTKDPEAKASYRFIHHEKAGGPANVRAAVSGIAALNMGAVELNDEDRQAVYDHLAGHLRDADREPPLLRPKGDTMPADLRDEIAGVLVGMTELLKSTDRVVALRAEKGKQLSRTNIEYLGWLDESLMAAHMKLRSLLDSPDDVAAREFLRYIQQQQALGGRNDIPGTEGSAG